MPAQRKPTQQEIAAAQAAVDRAMAAARGVVTPPKQSPPRTLVPLRQYYRSPQPLINEAVSNAPGSAWNLIKGLGHAVAHPLNTGMGIWDTAAGALAHGVGAIAPSLVDRSDPNTKRALDTASNVAQFYRNRYGTTESLRNTIASDPVGAAADLSMLLGGAELATARLAPEASAVLRTAARATNPLTPVGALASRVAKPLLRNTAPVLDTAGELTPAARTAIEQSGLDPTLFDDPALRQTWATIANAPKTGKGVSAASAREALLRHTGASTVTNSMAAGEKPVVRATSEANAARAAAREETAAQLAAKAPAPVDTAIGASFIDQYLAAQNRVRKAYEQAYSHTGEFAPEAADDFQPILERTLQSDEFSTLPNKVGDFSEALRFPETSKVLYGHGRAQGVIDRIKMLAETPNPTQEGATRLTMPELESVRRDVNSAWGKATGDDRAALSAVNKAIDDFVATEARAGRYSGDPDTLVSDMANARQAYRDLQTGFVQHPNTNIRGAARYIDKFTDENNGLLGVKDDAAASLPGTVQDTLLNGVVGKDLLPMPATKSRPRGSQTFEELTAQPSGDAISPLGPEGVQSLADHIRHQVYTSNLGTSDLDAFLQGKYGQLVSPEEQATLRQYAASNDILAEKPAAASSVVAKEHPARRLALPTIGAIGGSAMGAGVQHLIGMPPIDVPYLSIPGIAGAAGAAGGAGLERLLTRGAGDRLFEAEMAGAQPSILTPDYTRLTEPALAAERLQTASTQPEADKQAAQQAKQAAPMTPEDFERYDEQLGAQHAAQQGITGSTRKPGEQPSEGAQMVTPDEFEKMNAGGRIERKDGGRVDDIEHLVVRLMNKTKHAKKQINKTTEALLNHDDSAIVSALGVAQKAI